MIRHTVLPLAVLVCAGSLWAQNETAVLEGRVTDPSGLGVPNARVRLTRQSTGAARETLSSGQGDYRLDLLDPGDYSIQASVPGFKTFEDSKIHLAVAQTSQLDIRLTVGATSDAVKVEADVSPLETGTAAQGTVIGQEKVQALPLNGRQFLQLALMSPAVNSGGIAVQQNALRQGEIAGLSVAGRAPTIRRTCWTAWSTPIRITTRSATFPSWTPSPSSRCRWPSTAPNTGAPPAGRSTC